jgi:hypothetical protein
MTQDPYGRPPGSGSVVRGEIVPDDEANETPPNGPLTHFLKVASALRGDRTDPAAPTGAPSDSGYTPTGPQTPDPNGTWPRAAAQGATAADDLDADVDDADVDDTAPDGTRPEDVVAVRSPDAENRDYWDDEDERAAADRPVASAAEPVTSPVAVPVETDAAEPGASAAEPVVAPDGAAADGATQDPTSTQPDVFGAAPVAADAAAAGAAGAAVEPEAVGRHAGAPAAEEADPAATEVPVAPVAPVAPVQGGLRPGESDGGLADFSDLTFGSLLPDAAEFKTRWQQVQFRFVDDPTGSVTEAADVVAQLTAKLEAAIQERQRAIAERQRTLRGRWSEGKSTDTESLRETLLMYRAFLDQLTGPKFS